MRYIIFETINLYLKKKKNDFSELYKQYKLVIKKYSQQSLQLFFNNKAVYQIQFDIENQKLQEENVNWFLLTKTQCAINIY